MQLNNLKQLKTTPRPGMGRLAVVRKWYYGGTLEVNHSFIEIINSLEMYHTKYLHNTYDIESISMIVDSAGFGCRFGGRCRIDTNRHICRSYSPFKYF